MVVGLFALRMREPTCKNLGGAPGDKRAVAAHKGFRAHAPEHEGPKSSRVIVISIAESFLRYRARLRLWRSKLLNDCLDISMARQTKQRGALRLATGGRLQGQTVWKGSPKLRTGKADVEIGDR